MMTEEENEICEISGCGNEAARSIATNNLRKALSSIQVEDENRKRTRVCKDHYKQFKKATKEERDLQRLGW